MGNVENVSKDKGERAPSLAEEELEKLKKENSFFKNQMLQKDDVIQQFLSFRTGNFYDFKKALAYAKKLEGEDE